MFPCSLAPVLVLTPASYRTSSQDLAAVAEAEPSLRMVRAARCQAEPDPLRRVRLQILDQVRGGGQLPQGENRRRGLLEVETDALLLRPAADEERVRGLGVQTVQAGSREL